MAIIWDKGKVRMLRKMLFSQDNKRPEGARLSEQDSKKLREKYSKDRSNKMEYVELMCDCCHAFYEIEEDFYAETERPLCAECDEYIKEAKAD